MTSTLTTNGRHDYQIGDTISVTRVVPETRWWVVAWAWLLRRPPRMRNVYEMMTVTDVTATTIKVHP